MMRRLIVLAGLGLLTACGQSGSNLSEDVSNSLNVIEGDLTPGGNAGDPLNASGNAMANSADSDNVIVGGLPLRLGFYVSSETDCGSASNANVTLMRRDGYSGERYSCRFGAIEKLGAATYRVTESCAEGTVAGRQEEERRTSIRTYDVSDEENFSAQSDSGWANKARFCAQSSLPKPWRDQDISDVIGTAPPERP